MYKKENLENGEKGKTWEINKNKQTMKWTERKPLKDEKGNFRKFAKMKTV
jgi:hypothetical protein